MSDKPYSPMGAIRRATRSMNKAVSKHSVPQSIPQTERTLTLSSTSEPVPCAVLLRSLTDNGPVPDDFQALPKTASALKAYIRPDGAVYKGAFELQGQKDSVVLVWGPKSMLPVQAEKIATFERLALTKRHESSKLGIFAAHPAPNPSSNPSTNAG